MIRLLLDNHLSPAVARALREKGYDVAALQETPRSLRDLPDHTLLDEATQQGRAVVTYNIKDFVPLHRIRLGSKRSHAGIVLISNRTIRQDDIGGQVRALETLLKEHADPETLRDQLVWLELAGA